MNNDHDREIRNNTIRHIIITICEIAAIAAVIWFIILAAQSISFAEGYEDCEVRYVLCKDYVNVRISPNKKQEPIGWLEAGDMVFLDGKQKNGYVHCVGLTFEYSEGWVYEGYLVSDQPEALGRNATIVSKGRLAARKYVGGRRTRWLKPLATVRIYYWSDEWCLTNCGYVQTRYLELEGE